MSSPCRREFLASSIVIGASDGFGEPLAVAGEAPDIWGQTILAQPFDKGPFREIKLPAWVQETIGCGYTLSGMDSAERKAAAEMGVTISEMGFVDPVLRLLRQQAAQAAQPARPARPAGEGHRRVQEARRPHPGRLSAVPPGRGLRDSPRLAADRDQHRPRSPRST